MTDNQKKSDTAAKTQQWANELVGVSARGFWAALADTLFEPMFLLLAASSATYFILGETASGFVTAAFALIATVNDFVQEYRCDKSLRELRNAAAPVCEVVSDQNITTIPCSNLAPGDLIRLGSGDVVPADARIIESDGLLVDESVLHGGQASCEKFVDSNDGICFAGSVVLRGSATAKVEGIAGDTEYSRQSFESERAERRVSSLQNQMNSLVKYTALAAGAMFLLVGILTYLNLPLLTSTQRVLKSLLAGVTLAVSVMPEEFPVILAVFLTGFGIRLRRKNVGLARRLHTTEKLGVVTSLLYEKELELTDAEIERLKLAGITAVPLSGSDAEKLAELEKLHSSGKSVAVVTDDRALLSSSDVGIAFGRTEISRQTADFILEKACFENVFEMLRDGRKTYANIKKAVGYVFAIHLPVALAALLAPLLKIPHDCLLLLPMHIVMLELVVDPTCSALFGRLPSESDIMGRPARSPSEKLFSSRSLIKSLLEGAAIFAASFGCYYYMLLKNGLTGASSELARGMGLLVFILANMFLFFALASDRDCAAVSFSRLVKGRACLAALLLTLVLIIVAFYTPLAGVLRLAPPSPVQFLICVALAAASTLWADLSKLCRKAKA